MSTATESKHTAGALRAARLISCSDKLRPLVLGLILRQEARESWAEIIDRETAAPAMLEALEGITKAFECAYRAALDPSIYDTKAEWEEAVTTNTHLMRAKAAIRLAKGESQ